MKHIGSVIGKSIKQTEEEPKKTVALTKIEKIWFDQINYHALMKGLKPPENEEAIIKAKGLAKSLECIVPACIAECWGHSRKHDSWVDESTLMRAWHNVVRHNYHYEIQRKQSHINRLERSQPLSEQERFDVMKATWATAQKNGLILDDEIKNKYGI